MEMQQHEQLEPTPPGTPQQKADDFTKEPGFFQRFELQQVVKNGAEYYIVPAGKLTDGTELYSVYKRPPRGRRLP
jgi:hypothetical protein